MSKVCEWCKNPFEAKRPNQVYCSAKHRRKAENARRSGKTIDEAATVGPFDAQAAIEALEMSGYTVTTPQPIEPVYKFDPASLKGKDRIRIAVVSDTHLCSTYQQITMLREFYEYAEKEAKVDAFLHAGDLTDGPHQAHRDAPYNLFRHGADAQKDYIVEAYPETKLKTYVIGGNHDYMHINQNGYDIVRDICEERDDMEYLGSQHFAHVDFGRVRVQMVHPYKGGAYALTYNIQKYIEGLASERKPHIVLMGNFHRMCYLPGYRNVEGWLLPCFQAQTPFMAGKNINPVLGGVIIEFGQDPHGLAASVKNEVVRFPRILEHDYPGGEQYR